MKSKKTKSSSRALIAVLIFVPILTSVISWILDLNFLISTLMFLGIPALYLSLQDKSKIKRNLIFSSLFTIPGIYVDYMARKDLAWDAPSSLFSFRIAGVVPVENIVWFFLLSYFIVAFYEHFFDRVHHKTVGRRMKLLFAIVTIGTVAFIVPFFAHQQQPIISYFYLKLGLLLGLLPISLFLFKFPRYLSVFIKIVPYFLAISLLEEFVGLHNGYWAFPGQHFIGWINIGSYRFPYEELIFWMIMFSAIVITYFELFDDNRLKFKRLTR